MASVVEVDFPRGRCPIHLFGPSDDPSVPAILLFMDAFGPRDALFSVAEAVAAMGYRVMLPDLFYEHRPYRPLDPASLFSGGEDRQRLGSLLQSLTPDAISADVAALLAYCRSRSDEGVPIGASGYCMGGRFALAAATLSPNVAAAATFHASTLAPIEGDGPHKWLKDVRARVYIGVAGIDPSFGADEEGRLAEALRRADVDYLIETYAGAAHGFVMQDLPVHDVEAAARHLSRLRELFGATLERPDRAP